MDRNPDLAASLDLTNANRAIVDVLTTHTRHVGAALAGIEQECEGEPCTRTNGMVPLELLKLAFGPGMKAVALGGRDLTHIAGRIVGPHSNLDSVLHQPPQGTAQCVGGTRRVGSGREKLDNVLAL